MTPEYRYYLANAQAANRRYNDALSNFNTLKDDPVWGSRSRYYLGHIATLAGNYPIAMRCYQASKEGAASGLDLGRLCLLQGDAAAAEGHFAQALAQTANSPGARLGLALAKADLGDTDPLHELTADPDLRGWAAEPIADQAYEDRRYVEALAGYEQAIQNRRHVSSKVLCRLAMGYLQLSRYREALPHLVELSRRHHDNVPVHFNLALCRYQLGRTHFRQKQWELARAEWARSAHLLRQFAAAEAESVHLWEREAAYRTAVQIVTSGQRGDLARAIQLLKTGTTECPSETRWHFAAGVANALAGNHWDSAVDFASARKLAPDRPSVALGHGLSLQAAGQGAEASAALQQAVGLAQKLPGEPFHVPARFALVMCLAQTREWGRAARELQPLLNHPLVTSGKRISQADIAQVLVAYYALAGSRDEAAAIARKHGIQGDGALMTALVQAESGDYAGAAGSLAELSAVDSRPAVRSLLLSCLLAAAAERVRNKDLKGAGDFVKRALACDPNNKDARRLQDALSFGSGMQTLDPKQLGSAMQQCEDLIRAGSTSAQLLRTLAVLHHRKAIDAERRKNSPEAAWDACLKFWRERILKNDSFWSQLGEEYNAGKRSREQVKPDDLTKWRADLPLDMANAHASFVAACLKSRDRDAMKRHLGLIWQWAPDFEPPNDFLLADLGQIDESMAGLLEELSRGVSGKLRKTLTTLAAGFWNGKAVATANRADHTEDLALAGFKAAGELIQRLGAAALIVVKGLLGQARDNAKEARQLAEEACRYIEKAFALDPDAGHIRQNREALKTVSGRIQTLHETLAKMCRELGIW